MFVSSECDADGAVHWMIRINPKDATENALHRTNFIVLGVTGMAQGHFRLRRISAVMGRLLSNVIWTLLFHLVITNGVEVDPETFGAPLRK